LPVQKYSIWEKEKGGTSFFHRDFDVKEQPSSGGISPETPVRAMEGVMTTANCPLKEFLSLHPQPLKKPSLLV